MKSFHPATPKYGLRPHEASFALGSEVLLDAAKSAGWIQPKIQQHKLTLYDAGDVARVWSRICAGETPFDAR